MKKKAKRILSGLLCVMMVIGLFSIPALEVKANGETGLYIIGDGSGGGGGAASGSGWHGGAGGNGGGGNDTIYGTAGNDVIFGDGSGGGAGGRSVGNAVNPRGGLGGSGNDTIYGGPGNDVIFGDGFNGQDYGGWFPGKGGLGGGGGGAAGGFFGSPADAANGGIGGGGGGRGGGTNSSSPGNTLIPGVGFSGVNVQGGNGGNSATSIGVLTGVGGLGDTSAGGGGGGFGGAAGGAGRADSNGLDGAHGDTNQHAYEDTTGSIRNYFTEEVLRTLLINNPNFGEGNDIIDGGPGHNELFGLGGNNTFIVKSEDHNDGGTSNRIWDFKAGDILKLKTTGVLISQVTADTILQDAILGDFDNDGKANDTKLVFNGIPIYLINKNPSSLISQANGEIISVNTAPIINLSDVGFTYTLNSNRFFGENGFINDIDGNSDWNGGTLKIQITSNAIAQDAIGAMVNETVAPILSFNGLNVTMGGITIGTMSHTGGTPVGAIYQQVITNNDAWIITFNENAKNEYVRKILDRLIYRSSNSGVGNRTITVTATDRWGNASSDTVIVGTYAITNAVAPSNIVLSTGSAQSVGSVTNVQIPAAGGNDTTGAVTGWVTGIANRIKFTVTDSAPATSTITINAVPYTSGNDYTITSTDNLYIVVTTTEAGKLTVVRNFMVTVAGETYQIIYNGNENSSGTVPTDATNYSFNALATVIGNTGTLAKVNHTFMGWNTSNVGTGTTYLEGHTFNISTNTTLYALWKSNQAGLTSVAGQTDNTPGAQSGADTNNAITWAVSVANGKETLARAEIVASTNATFNLYSNVDFTTEISGGDTLPLTVGNTTAYIKVAAQDATTIKYYAVTINRAGSSNANLSELSLSNGTLSPEFASGTTSYTASVANVVSSITVTPTKEEANASIKVNDVVVTSGQASGAINLNVGENTITVVVTAQDGTTLKTYTVIVTRAASSNANLSELSLSNGTLSPEFASGTTSYTASVANVVSSITVTPTKEEANASIKVNDVVVTSGQASGAINLNVGENTITVVVTAQDTSSKTYTARVTRAAPASSGGSSSMWTPPIPTPIPTPTPSISITGDKLPEADKDNEEPVKDIKVGILIDDEKKDETAKASVEVVDEKVVVTVKIDKESVMDKIKEVERKITIPVSGQLDIFISQLDGDVIKEVEKKASVIEIKTDTVAYALPAAEISIESIAKQFGENVQLKDLLINIAIEKSAKGVIEIVESIGKEKGLAIIAPPVEFRVTVSHGDKTIEINKFASYVERTVAIPDVVDPSQITTGVVVDSDGELRHVPTKVVIIDGRYYAVINSLTNSSYLVVWNPKEFKDMSNHWAKQEVNDMGSKMVISGTGNGVFEPNRDITRAEFAAIVVRGLGLKAGTENNPFNDVKDGDWYLGYIETAYEYGIISGYGNGKFGPNDKITREQAMVMISRAMNITKLNVDMNTNKLEEILGVYIDSDKSSEWAKEGIAKCINVGIVEGRKEGKILAPKDNISRVEVAVIVRRLLQKSGLI
ncbi:UNVERIFIED_CONTAM: Ca2+-binding RTX toxin-like protein [Acetivibrio alkalicellulosi]